MKIKDVELLTGLSSKEIIEYEEEGLLYIEKDEKLNRKYNEKNIEDLKKIKVLRKLGVSILKLKKYSNDEIDLKSILEEKLEELNKCKDNLNLKIGLIKNIIKKIDKDKEIDFNDYLEKIDYIENDKYIETREYIKDISEISLANQLLITLIFIIPFISFYNSIINEDYSFIVVKSAICILLSILLTLRWKRYLGQKDKKVGGTVTFLLALVLGIIFTVIIYLIINQIQKSIFVPRDYLMYLYKKPYSYIVYLFEIEILFLIIGFLAKLIKGLPKELKWMSKIFDILKNNIIKLIFFNIILLYVGVTGIVVVTNNKIIDYNFYNPFGREYSYNDITNVKTGFYAKRNLFFGANKGEFYYKVTLKNQKEIDFYQSQSKFEDTYLELETFDRLIVDTNKAKKISSKDNYKLCDLDKRYVNRFLKIIENK